MTGSVPATTTGIDRPSVFVLDTDSADARALGERLVDFDADLHCVTNYEDVLTNLLERPCAVLAYAAGATPPHVDRFAAFITETWPWIHQVVLPPAEEAREAPEPMPELPGVTVLSEPLEAGLATALDEARAEAAATTCLARAQYHCQLSNLARSVQHAIEAGSMVEAMRRMTDGLQRSLQCDAVAILDVEQGVAHMLITVHAPGLEPILAEIQERLFAMYELIGGKPVDREGFEPDIDVQVPDNAPAAGDTPRIHLIPFLTTGVIRGAVVVVDSGPASAWGPDQLAFFSHAPNYLSTVFNTISQMRLLAIQDSLTGLYNQLYMTEALFNAVERARRYGTALSLAMIDLDYFKQINDELGHFTGDEVLCEFADSLRQVARRSDIIGRTGGDEFMVILPETDLPDAVAFGKRLVSYVREHVYCELVHDLRLTVSGGVTAMSVQPEKRATAQQLLIRADEALYAAKHHGRDQFRTWPEQSDPGKLMAGVTPAVPAISEPKSVRAEAKVTLANRIMVVDDEPEILRFLERALSAKGYGVEVYSSAEACLQALRTPGRQYDVILTDVRMPNKSGLELLEELHEEDDSIIKIVMTGTATVDTAIASLRHGAYDFVEKPVPLKQLLAILERATEYRRIMLENREYRNNLEAMVEEQSTELRHTLEKVKRSYDFTLEAMAGLLDAREQDSGQHSKRVRDLALVLGSHMGLPTDELQVVAQGALLHDIGKIGVPDSVLRKADALDEDEWELMRGHPALGYRVLRSADWLRNVAEIVYAHHERYDGDGYPRGIAGDEICLGARIFAVIDSYDAMRSDRVYRKALSAEHARSEVLNGSGTQFDPGVVEAFRACADEIERVFREMSDGASR